MSSSRSNVPIVLAIVAYFACAFLALLATDFYGQAARGSTDQRTLAHMAVTGAAVAFVAGTFALARRLRPRPA